MHIAIEAVGTKHRGGAAVLIGVVEAALRSSIVERVTIFCSPRHLRKFSLDLSSAVIEVECAEADGTPFGRLDWLLRRVDMSTRTADALICMNGMGLARIPTLAFIQQALPFCPDAARLHPLNKQFRIKSQRWLMRVTCKRAAAVIVQTAHMADLVQQAFSIDESNVLVAGPWGQELGLEEERPAELRVMLEHSGPRLLYVGNTSPYKNLGCLTSALTLLRRRVPGCTLFVTCPPDDPVCRVDGVFGLGSLGRDGLRRAYSAADLFVTASLVESAGLPLTEAMHFGVPIAAADRPYARELCHDVAEYFDPLDASSAFKKISGLLQDPARRARMAAQGRARSLRECQLQPYDRIIRRIETLAQAECSVC